MKRTSCRQAICPLYHACTAITVDRPNNKNSPPNWTNVEITNTGHMRSNVKEEFSHNPILIAVPLYGSKFLRACNKLSRYSGRMIFTW